MQLPRACSRRQPFESEYFALKGLDQEAGRCNQMSPWKHGSHFSTKQTRLDSDTSLQTNLVVWDMPTPLFFAAQKLVFSAFALRGEQWVSRAVVCSEENTCSGH